MTPDEAIQILTQLADQYVGNWASHQAVRTALKVLYEKTREAEKPSPFVGPK